MLAESRLPVNQRRCRILAQPPQAWPANIKFAKTWGEFSAEEIVQAINAFEGNVAELCRAIGLPERALYYAMKRLGVVIETSRVARLVSAANTSANRLHNTED